MKRNLIYLFAATALTAAGCAEKENADKGFGRLTVAGTADGSVATRSVIETPAADAFGFELTGDDYEGRWPSVAAFAQTDTVFREGNYTARITHGDPEAEGVGKAYFCGEERFFLHARRTNTVSVTARLANSQTLVRATEQFLAYYHDAQFTVTTASGNEFIFAPRPGESEEAVFVQAGTALTVTGTALRQSQTGADEGLPVEFAATSLPAAKPRTCHLFTFDAPDAGSATVTILFSEGESVIEPVTIELNDEAISDKK